MIVKFINIFLKTNLSSDSVIHYIEKNLERHVKDTSDFDLEHFIEILEDTEHFKTVETAKDFNVEFTQDEVDDFVQDVLESEFYDDDDEDDDYEDEDEDEDDNDENDF